MIKPSYLLIVVSFISLLSYGNDFIKISKNGHLKDENSLQWDCVLDKTTGLIWEVKKINHKLQNALDTYSWFDGKSGTANGKYSNKCFLGSNCNTQNYIKIINEQKLCSFSNWRLPTVKEITTIIKYGTEHVTIDKNYFPNTQSNLYWTSNESSKNKDIAWDIPFFEGGSAGSEKKFNSYVRLVTDANEKYK